MKLPAQERRQLVVSLSARSRLDAAIDWLSTTPGPVYLLAERRAAADELVREAAVRSGRPLLSVYRSTLLGLAAEISALDLARQGRTGLSGLAAEALAARAAHEARQEGVLGRLLPIAGFPGFPAALSSTLEELRRAGIEEGELEGVAAPELSGLLRLYQEQLEAWRLADAAEVFSLATKRLTEGWSGLTASAFVWLDLSGNRACESRFLAALAASCSSVLALLPKRDAAGVARIEELLGVSARSVDDPAVATRRLERVQRGVFESDIEASHEAVTSDSEEDLTFEFFSASTEGQEGVEIARRLRDLAAAGTAFDRMAILVRRPSSYLPLLEEALARARVPAYLSRGAARPDAAGRAFLALLACADEGLSATRFAEYLSLGQVPRLTDGAPVEREVPWVEPSDAQLVLKSLLLEAGQESSPSGEEALVRETGESDPAGDAPDSGSLPTPSRWEHLLVNASVVGGVARWHRRLDGLRAELEAQLRGLRDEAAAPRLAIEGNLERLDHLARFALPVVDRLSRLPARATWGEWLLELEKLAGFVLRDPTSVLALLGELRPMGDVGPVDLLQVQQVLAKRLNFLRREPQGRPYGRVFVGTVEEAVSRSFEVVFVPGLAEGIFPRALHEDPLLLDEKRQKLEAELPLRQDRVVEERSLLELAVGAAERRLVVSYPRLDSQQGRSRVPSFYALDLLRAADGAVPDLDQLAKSAVDMEAARLGWPAPHHPERAIDDAEYDLALLAQLLDVDPVTTRGKGRFLLYNNEHLSRSLRARARKWRRMWSEVDGLVLERGAESTGEGSARQVLDGQGLGRRAYSPTALQNFAACPYRFLLQAIHRLRPRDELVQLERLDPLTRGSLFHETQFRVLTELRAQALLPICEANLEQALDRADGVYNATVAEYEERLAPAIPRIWEVEVESLRTDLRGWLRQLALEEWTWCPSHFELAFGLPRDEEHDPRSTDEPVAVLDGVLLRGSIDLVERHAGGHRLRVTDHKTGRARKETAVVVGGGEVLQPVLYSLVAERLLDEGQRPPQVEAGRLSYCTQRGGYTKIEVRIDDEARSSAQRVVATVREAMEEGFLPAAPRPDACRFCDYRLVCGPYEELRTSRKPQEPLAALLELRRLR